jgi:hypothetical protein
MRGATLEPRSYHTTGRRDVLRRWRDLANLSRAIDYGNNSRAFGENI